MSIAFVACRKNNNFEVFWQLLQTLLRKRTYIDAEPDVLSCGENKWEQNIMRHIGFLVTMDEGLVQIEHDCIELFAWRKSMEVFYYIRALNFPCTLELFHRAYKVTAAKLHKGCVSVTHKCRHHRGNIIFETRDRSVLQSYQIGLGGTLKDFTGLWHLCYEIRYICVLSFCFLRSFFPLLLFLLFLWFLTLKLFRLPG